MNGLVMGLFLNPGDNHAAHEEPLCQEENDDR
jgi:hypothetical protein